MQKFFYLIAALSVTLSACATPTPLSSGAGTTTTTKTTDNPLGSLLGGLKNAGSSQDEGNGSTLGNALGGLLSGLLSNDKVTAEQMVGTWDYESPAVCFQSENFLQKAGGSAVAGTIEGKLAPYYKTFGLNKLSLIVNEDKSFTMSSGAMKLSGTIEADGSGDVYFQFTALGSINLGKMKAYVVISGNSMSLMFDVSKLMTIVKGVGSVLNNSTVNTMVSLLESYDGICAGFKLSKQ